MSAGEQFRRHNSTAVGCAAIRGDCSVHGRRRGFAPAAEVRHAALVYDRTQIFAAFALHAREAELALRGALTRFSQATLRHRASAEQKAHTAQQPELADGSS